MAKSAPKTGFSRHKVQSSVARYMIKRPASPSQGWLTFLRNHSTQIAVLDMFVVPSLPSVRIRMIGDFGQVQMASGGAHLKIIVLFAQLIQVDNAQYPPCTISNSSPNRTSKYDDNPGGSDVSST